MNEHYCQLHKAEMQDRMGKTGKPYIGHFVTGEGMCFGKATGAVQSPVIPSEPVREPLKEPNWDAIAEGKVRHGIVIAVLEKEGLHTFTEPEKEMIRELTQFVMTGK